MKRHVILNKIVGETPLSCLEAYRAQHHELTEIPMAYAGRLDPMASGKLLVLIGDECKVQEKYHNLDKEYEFQILFGISSDTQDVLGIVNAQGQCVFDSATIKNALSSFRGGIELSYPHYSSKTVKGKPLHTWTLENRLDEITIPTKQSQVHKLALINVENISASEVYRYVSEKIETIPKVTDERKAIGNDFRRDEVRASWKKFSQTHEASAQFTRATLRCICSSGTYMRSLAQAIAEKLGTNGLAYAIHRTEIVKYTPLPFGLGFWTKRF